MNRAQIFPAIMIVMNLGAAVMCASCGDWKRAGYWIAAAFLNYFVSF